MRVVRPCGRIRLRPPPFEFRRHETIVANRLRSVRLKLYKGSVTVVGRQSPASLYSQEHVTFEEDAVYNQADATGFIKLNALRLRLLKMRRN